jgi:hypothetical protein
VRCGRRRRPGRVVSLSLPSRDLAGTIPPAITFLRRLYLRSNVFSGGEIPRAIGQLHRLRELVVVRFLAESKIISRNHAML